MKLPSPPPQYDPKYEGEKNRVLEQSDFQNLKRLADVEVVDPQRLILRSPNGTRYKITVSNSGVLSATTL
jgi:hypothetical protein